MPASTASTDDESDSSQVVDYEQMNAYEILGVGINATQAEIDNTWRTWQRELHPDHHHSSNKSSSDQRHLHAINAAYELIQDECDRHEYNWNEHLIPHNTSNRIRLAQLRNRRADTQMNSIEHEFDAIRRAELQKKHGIIIMDARYGDTDYIFNIWMCMKQSGHELGTVTQPEGVPKTAYRDVTAPIQCMVTSSPTNPQSSHLILPATSKSELRGFAEPLTTDTYTYNSGRDPELALWILYRCGKELYSIAVDDVEDVGLPSDEHKLHYTDAALQQWNAIKNSKTAAEIRRDTLRKRRNTLLGLTFATIIGTVVYQRWQRHRYPQSHQSDKLLGIPLPQSLATWLNGQPTHKSIPSLTAQTQPTPTIATTSTSTSIR